MVMASLKTMRSELSAVIGGAETGLAAADQLCAACVDLFGIDGAAVSTVHDGAPQWTFGSSSERSRRLDEFQFTFGEGPCIDAVSTRRAVLVPDLRAAQGQRWPVFAEAMLADGFHGVFAFPIMVASRPIGALDLFRTAPGPLQGDELTGAVLAAELAARPLLDLLDTDARDHGGALEDHGDRRGPEDEDDTVDPDAEPGTGSPGRGLPDAMDLNRVEVYQATGMLIHQLGVGPGEAVLRLRAHAMSTGQTASQVAFAIIKRRLVLERDDRDDDGGGTGWDHQ